MKRHSTIPFAARDGAVTPSGRMATKLPPYPVPDDPFEVVRVTFDLPADCWLNPFSHRHPALRIDALNTLSLSAKYVVSEWQISATEGDPDDTDWTKEIGEFSDVVEVDKVGLLPGLSTYRVVCHAPFHLSLAVQFGLLFRYPRTMRAGTFTCETVARRTQVKGFVDAMVASGRTISFVSVGAESLHWPRLTLTAKQRDLFRQALAKGYFEVPRRITLAELARDLHQDESSVLGTLAVIERNLAEQASLTVI